MLRRKSTKILFGLLTILIIALGALEVNNILTAGFGDDDSEITTKQIGPYVVNAQQTERQEQLEEQLLAALDANDQEAIKRNVTEYFVSDFFTLRDKRNLNDIGGIGFVLPDTRARFSTNAIDSYYRDLADFKNAFDNENLPLVVSVELGEFVDVDLYEIEVEVESDNEEDEEDNEEVEITSAFDVEVTWIYEESNVIDVSQIVDNAIIRLVISEGIVFVYEIRAVNTPDDAWTGW
jgi:hypothetical protein